MVRAVAGILRGKATPFQILMACILGAMIGFVPSLQAGAGALLALIVLLIILNANLALAAIVAGGAKLLSLAIMPATFQVGRVLLDGPTSGLFRKAINAPGSALLGLEYYTTTGGIALGLLIGITLGLLVSGIVKKFRKVIATYEAGSAAFQAFTTKPLNKFIMWVFFGGKGKGSYADMMKRKIGLPIRVSGVVLATLVVGLGFVGYKYLSGPIVTSFLRAGLERANGATVDLASADIDAKSGKITLTGLAVCDASEPTKDLFRAASLSGDVSGKDLLRKRISMDKVVAVDAMQGAARKTPGTVFRPPAKGKPETRPGEKGLEDYIKDAKEWKEKLSQVRRWLEEINKRRPDGGGTGAPGDQTETLEERLRRLVKEQGYTRVVASHLVEGAPTFLVRELEAKGVRVESATGSGPLAGQTLDIRGENLSTQPWLVQGAPRVVVTSSGNTIVADVSMGAASASGAGQTVVNLAVNGLNADIIGSQLIAIGGQAPLSGGAMDVAINANLTDLSNIDVPLYVTLRDSTLSFAGAGQARVSEFKLPIGLKGELDNPRIAIDGDALAQALAQAGAAELANRVKGEAGKVVDKALEDVKDKVGDQIGDEAGKVLDGIFGGGKKEEDK
jgi:uncharacterized protein (TIGR03546 family)